LASWTAPAERSGDGAFAREMIHKRTEILVRAKSGVALRFPPQSKTRVVAPSSISIRVYLCSSVV
jgi:hypothetical protein